MLPSPPLHLGALHPFEQLLVLLVAFGPFVVLAVVVYVVRRRDIADEERDGRDRAACERVARPARPGRPAARSCSACLSRSPIRPSSLPPTHRDPHLDVAGHGLAVPVAVARRA